MTARVDLKRLCAGIAEAVWVKVASRLGMRRLRCLCEAAPVRIDLATLLWIEAKDTQNPVQPAQRTGSQTGGGNPGSGENRDQQGEEGHAAERGCGGHWTNLPG